MKQLDLFHWAETKSSNIIDSRWRFIRKAEAQLMAIACGYIPTEKDGQLITPQFKRERKVA